MDKKYEFKDIDTKLVHAGEPSPRVDGAVAMPIFQSATFEYAGQGADYHDLRYIRLNNTPNHHVVQEKLAAIEGAEAAIVTASGMAAISTCLLTVLSKGDHLLIQDCLYGGTHDLLTGDFENFGITFDFIDATRPESWQEKLKPATKAIYVESISNPLLAVPDFEAVVELARRHKLISMVDNTFASPINFRPLALGFDLSIHSLTKYVNGHSDIVAGACLGSQVLVDRIRRLLNHLGGSLDPHAAFLLYRGMKTLALRVRHQNDSALALARFLSNHPAVRKVNYPGLESHPQFARASRLFEGFGGMLSFELNTSKRSGSPEAQSAAADQFIAALKIPIAAPSLGGVESLITRPATTSHAGMSKDNREALGISDSLIRFSTGIESSQDLIADFAQALSVALPEHRAEMPV